MSEASKSPLSILILGYDPYSDVWPYFDFFFSNKWTNCSYPRIFVSSQLSYRSQCGISSIKTGGDMSVSGRLLVGLKNIHTQYVLVLLEDYIVEKVPSDEDIGKLLLFLSDHNISFCQVADLSKKNKLMGPVAFNQIRIRNVSKKKRSYRANLQPAIWAVSFLRQACYCPFNRPWDLESSFCEKGQNYHLEQEQNVVSIPNGFFSFVSFIEKGKYTREARFLISSCSLPFPKRPFSSRREENTRKITSFFSSITPYWIKRILKFFGRKIGCVFYSK